MSCRFARVSGALVGVALFAILILVVGLGTVHETARGHSYATPRDSRGPSVGPLASRAAILTTTDPTISEGTPVDVQLNITSSWCTAGVPLDERFTEATLNFGDGFNTTIRSSNIGCSGAVTGTLTYVFTYVYHLVGTINVTALVQWADGSNMTSNQLQLTILAPQYPMSNLLGDWLAGITAAGVVGGCAAAIVARYLPTRPPIAP
jgi:hypothetical protein